MSKYVFLLAPRLAIGLAIGLAINGAALGQEPPLTQPAVQPSTPTTTEQTAEAPAERVQPQQSNDTVNDKPVAYLRADRLDLETTVVTGNRELPKVLYIVPWKKAELGELPAQPFNTLLDEVLAPVDRDVFKREVKYFKAIDSGATSRIPKPEK
ncbi:MAG: hypothetical protein H7Y02_08300 [Candidatus Obscuribacterales bacterium]|nr:hypothetical protein [Steroidobacteraceae bacterium]